MICITDNWYSECIALTVKGSVKLSFFYSFKFLLLFYFIKDSVNHTLNVLSINSIYHENLCEWNMISSRFVEIKTEMEQWTQSLRFDPREKEQILEIFKQS